MDWLQSIPENLRTKIVEWLKGAIDLSDIYERNREYGGPGAAQGYLNSKITLTDKIEGFCAALFMTGVIEYPVFVSVNEGVAKISRMDKDFAIRGTAPTLMECTKEEL